MKTAIALVSIALTGCAGFGELTPEQAAALMYMNSRQMPVVQAQQPIYRPVYIEPQTPAWQAPAPRPTVYCTTTNGGYALHTTCR